MLQVHSVLLAKEGLLPSECEDAVGVRTDLGRVCVADGATEAFDSRYWARLLTKHWARSQGLIERHELEPWWTALGARQSQRWAGRTLPWYAEEKAASGAFAAFVGVAFSEGTPSGYTWEAVALGDACLIHKRDGGLLQSLPISDPEQFGYHPRLVPSAGSRLAGLGSEATCASGIARPGDTFLLLTDAIAAWYLRRTQDTPEAIREFERLLEDDAHDALASFVTAERGGKRLRNDDVAAVLVRTSAPTSPLTA